MNDDRDLQQRYLSERATHQKAPEFEAMWARAVDESTASKPSIFARPALPALMAMAAIVVALTAATIFGGVFLPKTPDNDDALASFVLDLESEQTLAFLEWEAPTDFLLSTNDDWFYEP